MSRELRVLVVDDNPQDRRLVVRELRKAYPLVLIQEAIDQTQLDARIGEAQFDLVVTDYHLQWSDGIAVLKTVKQRVPNCPVIMFTATGNEEVAVEAMKQGLDDYIIKSVKHLVRLRGAVQAVLENAMTQRRADQLASRLESLLSQLEVGVFSSTPDGRFLEVNDAMVALLGCALAADAYQKPLSSLFADTTLANAFMRQVVTSNAPQETEVQIRTAPGDAKVFRLNARRVATQGESTRIDGLLEDITRRRRAEFEAREAAVASAKIEMLSPREDDVLHEVVAGHANKVIARRLEISEKTVEKHRSNLMKKLGVRSVAEVVRLALLAEHATG